MTKKTTWRTKHKHEWRAAGMGILLLALAGCVGESTKPAPTMTHDQVRSNADKAFEKLKQEEKHRPADSAVTPY